jgi:hypothetical protein
MRRIDLTDYEIEVMDQGAKKSIPYSVKMSIIGALFMPELKLTARETLERDKLAHKINDCPEPSILLEEAEYIKILQSVETVRGFNRDDVEFIRRVLEAPQVEVREA